MLSYNLIAEELDGEVQTLAIRVRSFVAGPGFVQVNFWDGGAQIYNLAQFRTLTFEIADK